MLAARLEMKRRGFTALKFDVDVPTEYSLDDYNRTLTRREIDLMAGLVATLAQSTGQGRGPGDRLPLELRRE